ncbi:MAG TPA: CoA pyrophosphatase [Caulobacteraceae bacterium]|nr:CoA pyrophosphatase [Caulobacteraceae bacterium]
MSPDASPAEVREWVMQHLDPLDSRHPERPHRSDYDLNPELAPEGEVLMQAAVLVPIVQREEGLSVLLTRRADTLRNHTGQVALPGGRLDPGETPWQAALREAEEEIGLSREQVELVGMSTPYRTGTGFLVTPVVGFVTPPIELKPNPAEVADVFETPFGYLMDPANHERRFYDQPGGTRRWFYAITHEERVIWGATAGMLRALYDRLYGATLA